MSEENQVVIGGDIERLRIASSGITRQVSELGRLANVGENVITTFKGGIRKDVQRVLSCNPVHFAPYEEEASQIIEIVRTTSSQLL